MLKKILSDLVKFKTLSIDHDENRRALNWVKKQLQGLPVFFKDYKINNFPALVVTTKKTFNPKLLLQGHMDVVDGSASVFIPKEKNGKLYGRGVFDMKYATACYIKLFQDLGKDLTKFDLGIMLTTDEEIGGNNGVEALLKKKYKPKLCFLPDGGDSWKMQRSAKGVYQVKLIAKGISGHGSRPWTGVNALQEILSFVSELQKHFVDEPCGINNHNQDTLTVSRISGGKIINQIPDYAEAELDIRFIPKTGLKGIRKKVSETLNRYKNVSLVELSHSNAYEVNFNEPSIKLFISMLKKRGFKFDMVDSHGSCDARYFLDRKIPTVILRPVGGGHHTPEEWIDLNELEKFYELLKEFALKVA